MAKAWVSQTRCSGLAARSQTRSRRARSGDGVPRSRQPRQAGPKHAPLVVAPCQCLSWCSSLRPLQASRGPPQRAAASNRPAPSECRRQPAGRRAAQAVPRLHQPLAAQLAASGPPGPGHEAGRTRSAFSRCANRGLCLSSDASPVSGLDWAKQPRFACAAPSGSCIRAPTAVAVAIARGTHAASLIATGDSSGQGKLSITRELRCCNPCTRRTASREAWVWLMEPAPRVAGPKAGRHMCDWLGEGSGQR